MWNACLSFAYYPEWYADSKILIGLLALVVGVGGRVLPLLLPQHVRRGAAAAGSRVALMPYAFLAPGYAFIALMLLYPAIQTINYSFANADATEYVGLRQLPHDLGLVEFHEAIFNNILWLIVVPAVDRVLRDRGRGAGRQAVDHTARRSARA